MRPIAVTHWQQRDRLKSGLNQPSKLTMCSSYWMPSTLAGVTDEYAVPAGLVRNYASTEVGVYPASAIASRISSIVD